MRTLQRRSFTLIELLVVIAYITILPVQNFSIFLSKLLFSSIFRCFGWCRCKKSRNKQKSLRGEIRTVPDCF